MIAAVRSSYGSRTRWGRSLRLLVPGCLLAAVTGGICWLLLGPGRQLATSVGGPVDPALSRRLLQGAVRIAAGPGHEGGWGVLLDRETRSVVTVAAVVGEQSEVRVTFPVTTPAAETTGRVTHRDTDHDLVLLTVGRVPEQAEPLPWGDDSPPVGQPLYSLREEGTEAAGWVCQWAVAQRALMPPHFCQSRQNITPWMMGTESADLLCDAGAPVVDGQGELVAVGATLPEDTGGLARLIDVATVRALVQQAADDPK